MDDKDVKRDMRYWPFAIRDKGGKPSINVRYKGENRDFVCCTIGGALFFNGPLV